MRAPDFWWEKKPGLLALALFPAGWVYGQITAARMRRSGVASGRPIICVGNFTAGGAGKTPVAIEIAGVLKANGLRPAFLTRGFGGRARGPLLVDPALHDAALVGDEPMMLTRHAPVMVSRDRAAGAKACEALDIDVIIMDDGLQNPSLQKSLTFAVVDAEVGIGNALCVPAGPLRAPVAAQWPRTDALIVLGQGSEADSLVAEAGARAKPVFTAHMEMDPAIVTALRGRSLLAYAGIGRPAKFFKHLEAQGLDVVRTEAFPDHHAISALEAQTLLDTASGENLTLVTTEKDMARLGAASSVSPGKLAELRAKTVAMPIKVRFDDADGVTKPLLSVSAQGA